MSNTVRNSRVWVVCLSILILIFAAGCTASPGTSPAPAPESVATVPSTPPATPSPAPPMSDPLPAERVPSPLTIDSSCRVDADCAVKNVGNCCGAMPACVHKDSPTDPAAVQAECARTGMASVCGFKEIAACTCSDNQCIDAASPDGPVAR